jgi:thiamine biosynthesis lipoprotein
MGSDLHVIVWARGPAAERLADLAVLRVELLERCWSRFRPGSELNRLNARAGCGATAVSDDLRRLVTALVDAYTWSDGDVDASVLGAMLTLGYREDFASVAMSLPGNATPAPTAAPGLGGVRVGEGAVGLPAGVGLDPGGVGKGLAGDMVTEEIHDAGAHAVLVGIGGDVVTRGIPPDAGSWRVAMRDDRFDEPTECRVLDLTPRHRAGGDLLDPAATLGRRPSPASAPHRPAGPLRHRAGHRAGRLRMAGRGGRHRRRDPRRVERGLAHRPGLHAASAGRRRWVKRSPGCR